MALGLGFRGQSSASEAVRLIEHAIDSGINFIDCANKYQLRTDAADAHGSSEEILGRVLKTRRDQLVITSKGGAEAGGQHGQACRQVELPPLREPLDSHAMAQPREGADIHTGAQLGAGVLGLAGQVPV